MHSFPAALFLPPPPLIILLRFCPFLVLICFPFSPHPHHFPLPPLLTSITTSSSLHLPLVLASSSPAATSSSSSSSSLAQGSYSASSVCREPGKREGINNTGKQTTCFLPRSRVVKCADRNRNGQPCSRIRKDRMDGGRKITDRHSRYSPHVPSASQRKKAP